MDISLCDTRNGTQIEPTSIHGMLWLQTHFENNQWEAISSSEVILSIEDSKLLQHDATEAGLKINSLISMASLKK